ncbi:MAG: YfhO family protein [Candidatus Krumholzibacteriota bacterium]|nr:YfhO family protein [Candidatus Krumholzibacteriota bacterium]
MSKNIRSGDQKRREFDPDQFLDNAAGWRRGILVALFLVVVLAIVMPELIFHGDIFLVPDTKAPISFSEVGREYLESGKYPLWNPYIFCGMPSYPSLSYTPYVYPIAYVTYILQRYLGFPEMTWLLVHYILAGMGIYLLLRSFGVRSSISMLAGGLFMIMPNLVANGANGHGSQACAVAYMPYVFLFCRNILTGRGRVVNTAFLAIALGFQMLRGHVQISYYTYLITGLLFIMETIRLARTGKGKEIAVNSGFIFAAVILSAGIAAVLIFPVREYADYSIRGGTGGGLDYDYATGWSLPPKELLTLIFPWASGFGKMTYWGGMPFTDYPNYLGIVTAVFSVIGFFIVRSRWKWYLAVIIIVATFVSFGRFMPVLYDPLFRLLPFFNKFRVPVMILIVQQLAVTVLMGLAIEEYLQLVARDELPAILKKESLKWGLLAAVALFLLVIAASGSIKQDLAASEAIRSRVRPEWIMMAVSAYSSDLVRTLFFLVATIATLFFVSWKRPKGSLAIIILSVLLLFDIISVDRSIVHPESTWNNSGYRIVRPVTARERYKEPGVMAKYLAADTTFFRVFPVPASRPGSWNHSTFPFSDNSYMMSGIFSMGGYHAAKLKNYQDVMDLLFATFNRGVVPKQILNMLGAKYFLSMHPVFPEGSEYPLIYQKDKNYIYRNPEALPRVYFVDRIKLMTKEDALLSLTSNAFDPSREVILQAMPDGEIDSAGGSRAEITAYDLNTINIEAHVEKSCIMVVSEVDYPDWKVTIDGREGDILTANYCLRAIELQPGEHRIEFTFESPVLNRSLMLSIISIAIALSTVIISFLVTGRKGD